MIVGESVLIVIEGVGILRCRSGPAGGAAGLPVAKPTAMPAA